MSTIKIGMIGLDTSHCQHFVNLLHDESDPHHVPGGKVIGAYPGGSDLCAVSRDRVEKFTAAMRDDCGVAIYESIESLGREADAFLLESVDGRQHLDQFRALAQFGRPIFVDKPFACSLADAQQIAGLAAQKGVPLMSSSSIRFARGIANMVSHETEVRSCEAFGPVKLLDDYPGYFWYGIHSADVLFSYMGKGCRTVRVTHTDDLDLLVGLWADGRVGTVRGTRFSQAVFGCTVFTDQEVKQGLACDEPPYYALQLQEVMRFFQTGQPPIDIAETVEIMAFLDAAGRSLESGGQAVSLTE